MKAILVVPSTSSNVKFLNDNYQQNKENIHFMHNNDTNLLNKNEAKTDANVNTCCHKSFSENLSSQINTTDNNSTNSNSSNNSSINTNISDFRKLKRSHAIIDIKAMDDLSPVTYETSINSNTDWIEEDKIVISGIKVRAAKVPKLVQILIESFGEYEISKLPYYVQLSKFYFFHLKIEMVNYFLIQTFHVCFF